MKEEIYDFEQRIARYRRVIAGLRNGDVALRMLDHLASLGLSAAAISNHAAHLVAVLRLIDFDVGMATRSDVERVVAKINGNKRWREQTKYHKRVVLRRLIQYAKCGTCERGAPVPPEVGWIKLSKSSRDSRVTPENLLTPEEFEAIVRGAENAKDKAMLYVLFEGGSYAGRTVKHERGKCGV